MKVLTAIGSHVNMVNTRKKENPQKFNNAFSFFKNSKNVWEYGPGEASTEM